MLISNHTLIIASHTGPCGHLPPSEAHPEKVESEQRDGTGEESAAGAISKISGRNMRARNEPLS